MRRLVFLILLLTIIPLPASAGGSWMDTPDERIELGEQVELVGYVGLSVTTEWETESPWNAYLSPATTQGDESLLGSIEVGEVEISPTGLDGYLSHRVYLRFVVPSDIDPGLYHLSVTRATGGFLGDLIGAVLHLGIPGPRPASIEWALDEPLIGKLPDYATLSGPGFEVLVKDLRAGRYPPDAENYLLDPSILEQPGIVVGVSDTTAPPTTIGTVATSITAGAGADNGAIPTLTSVLLLLGGSAGLIALATRRRKVHVVLGVRPVTTPLPPDGAKGIDHHVSADNQARN